VKQPCWLLLVWATFQEGPPAELRRSGGADRPGLSQQTNNVSGSCLPFSCLAGVAIDWFDVHYSGVSAVLAPALETLPGRQSGNN
jgi:hypothetical protein